MRLEKIKLAGFKSFVDPTAITLPGRLIGVVGPNGCGKSNIIDAVRWVMGESSAKHLRGSAMSDVIFNGSSSRKPVGLATIELIFDNSEGKLGGEYARFTQISIKRQVSRDGQSQYFLNGSRCRRRDIMDVFFGTGLGPRSYAIIEQGTVSRFIEAKPEELRLFVEEAAGLSKYKERRRETELKLQHTRTNLERVEDIRGELQNQVSRLARQARKAQKYRELEQAIAQCSKELTAIQWQDASAHFQLHQKHLTRLEQRLEESGKALQQAETARGEAEKTCHELERRLGQAQARLYELNAEISRCDQNLRHARQTQAERERTLQSWRSELETAHATRRQDREQITLLADQAGKLESELKQSREELEAASVRQRERDAAWQQKRQEYGRCRDRGRSLQEKINLLEVEIRHLKRQREEYQQRLLELESRKAQTERSLNEQHQVELLQDQLEEIAGLRLEQQAQIEDLRNTIERIRSQERENQHALRHLESEYNRLGGRISALETLQAHALGKDRESVQKWLRHHGWQQAPRLAEILEVEQEWESAVEAALGNWLEALYLANPAARPRPETVAALGEENVAFLESGASVPPPAGSLAEKIKGPWNANTLLGRHRCAASLDEAYDNRKALSDHECWVTPEGDRIGPDWLQFNRQKDSTRGILEREQALRRLRGERERLARQRQNHLKRQQDFLSQQEQAEKRLEQLRAQEREAGARQARLEAECQGARQRLETARQNLERLANEYEALEQRIQRMERDRSAHENQLAGHRKELEDQLQTLQRLQTELDQSKIANEQATEKVRRLRENKARLESALEHTDRSLKILQKQLERTEERCQDLEKRLARAEAEQAQGKLPLSEIEKQLASLREKRPTLEKELADLRESLQQAENIHRDRRGLHARRESEREQVRSELESARLQAEAARVRLQTAQEQVEAEQIVPGRILSGLEGEIDAAEWQRRLERLQRDQARLGDVNLAAIEEHRLHSERLRFLDKQYDDLTASLAMLEKAIRTIDRETRSRFRETFEIVDGHFRRRFPALFGGGEARLEMTCDDPLEAGIRIMARPPGKRNSSIHLLSGGEKALTAVALVFSFFELNPAPFCMLDEVDAPLDEANVGRFCALLQSMSERVQFIFVTHNKTTMEIADQLIGVTMREPGVSRIVSVDLERAAEMAAA